MGQGYGHHDGFLFHHFPKQKLYFPRVRYRNAEPFVLMCKTVEFFGNSSGLNFGEEKGDRHKACFLLTISLDNKRAAAACDFIQNFSGATPEIHH